MQLIIVVPAYNEADRIVATILNIERELGNAKIRDYEIIVVVDGNDGTGARVQGIGSRKVKVMRNAKRVGKGNAISMGFGAAKGRIVGFVDADEAVPAQQAIAMAKFLRRNEKLCGVIASRSIAKEGLRRPTLVRRVFSFAFNVLARIVLGLRYYDTQCGAKFFRSEFAAKELPFRTWGFCIDVEMLYRLQKYGQIVEYPVDWSSKEGSKFSLVFVPQMFFELLKIRLSGR